MTTPIVPEWASSLTQKGAGLIGGVADMDPYGLVAPANALQNQAAAGAAGLTGTTWNYDGAADLARGVANTSWVDPYMSGDTPFASGGKASDYVDRYLNPYLHDVVDSTAADYDSHAGQVRAQQALDLAGSGAFGGSGAALTQSMTEGELARGRASTLSGLRSQAYNTALSAAGGDADRATQARIANAQTRLQDRAQKVGFGFQARDQQLAAANQLVGLSNDLGANQRGNIATQAQLGDTFRNIENERLQAPVTHAQHVTAMLSGLPMEMFVARQEHSNTVGKETTTKIEAHGSVGSKG
jgi:hypothetical protein